MELLGAALAAAGAHGAMIVQPRYHGFDHAYVGMCVREHAPRLQGSLLLDGRLAPEVPGRWGLKPFSGHLVFFVRGSPHRMNGAA